MNSEEKATKSLPAEHSASPSSSKRKAVDELRVDAEMVKARELAVDILNGSSIVLRAEDEVRDLLYSEELNCVRLRHSDFETPDVRENDIHLVLGSSGSGKTTLAVKYLASRDAMSKHAKESGGKYFVVYTLADNSFTIDGIIKEIQRYVNKESVVDVFATGPLNMSVCLILDEANYLKGKLDSKDTLCELLTRLEKDVAVNARLVVAGTGYDTLVAAVVSRTDVYKYDMRPWGSASVRGLVRLLVIDEKARATITDCLGRFPILSRLCSNPRVAVILFRNRSINDFMALDDRSDRTALAFLIQDVAKKYMEQNGLQKLDSQAKRIVARAVFAQRARSSTELDMEPSYAKIPESRSWLGNAARALVDQNYEIIDGKIVCLNIGPLITVSPALTVVLYLMIGASAQVLGSWQTLETIGALTCLRRGVIAERDLKRLEKYRLVKLHSAVPATDSMTEFRIPNLTGSAVWVNGDGASFADFCTRGVLGQSKYVTNPLVPAKIDLFDVCINLGLVKSSAVCDETVGPTLRLSEGILKALRHIWSRDLKKVEQQWSGGDSVGAEASMDIGPPANRLLHPEELLLGPETEPVPMVECTVDDTELRVGNETLAVQEMDVGAWDVLFFTNSVCFSVGFERYKDGIVESTSIKIWRDGVDASGASNDPDLREWATKYLKEDVKLRFFSAV